MREKPVVKIILSLLILSSLLIVFTSTSYSEDPVSEKDIDIPIKDPYRSNVLGYLLRSRTYLKLLGAELGLETSQRSDLGDIVERINQPASSPAEHSFPRIEEVDRKIKEILSPFQYVVFRDWLVQHWELAKRTPGFSVDEIARMNDNKVKFFETQLSLSFKTSQEISNDLSQHTKSILRFWKQLNLGKEPQDIIPQIKTVNNQMLESVNNKLSPQKRSIFEELAEE